MLGDLVAEDELTSGERREGIYTGFFTFLRKLGGASGINGPKAYTSWKREPGGCFIKVNPL